MKRLLLICSTLFVFLAVSGLTASAQEFKVDLSANVPFGADGPALDGTGLSVAGSTNISDFDIRAKAEFAMAGFSKAELTIGTTLNDIKLTGKATFGAAGFTQASLKAVTKVDDLDVEANAAFSGEGFSSAKLKLGTVFDAFDVGGEFNLTADGFQDATFSASSSNEEGGSLSAAMTMTPAGITQEVITIGVQVSGFSISRTSVISADSNSERWQMAGRFGQTQVVRVAAYQNGALASDTLTMTSKVQDFDVKKTVVFGPAGYANGIVEVGGKLDSVNFSSKTTIGPDFSVSESISLSTTIDQINLALAGQFTADGFQGGALSGSTSFTFNEAPEEPEEATSAE